MLLLAALFVFAEIIFAENTQLNTPSIKSDRNRRHIQITIVYDNNRYHSRLQTTWGFGCLIEGLEKTILFDIGGDSEVLLSNMDKLAIDPQQVDVVVLSRLHYDHSRP